MIDKSELKRLLSLNDEDNVVAQAVEFLTAPDETQIVQADLSRAGVSDGLKIAFERMIKLNGQLQAQLNAFYVREEINLAPFIDQVVGHIFDGASAFNAQLIYNAAWFKNLPFSNHAKIQLAQRLIETVGKFNPSYVLPLWHNLVNTRMAALNLVTFGLASQNEIVASEDIENEAS